MRLHNSLLNGRFQEITRYIGKNNQSSSYFSYLIFFHLRINNNVGSTSKSKKDVRWEKMSESVVVQNPTQVDNHEVEEDQFVSEKVFFLHVLCLAFLV